MSSEKQSNVIPEQLGVFNEAEVEQGHKASEPIEKTLTAKKHQRKRKLKRIAEELTVAGHRERGDIGRRLWSN